MKRGLTQVIYSYTPGKAFRHQEAPAWCRVERIAQQGTAPLPPSLREALSDLLTEWEMIRPVGPFPDPVASPDRYVGGEPYQISYTLAPLIFECRTCRRVHFFRDLEGVQRSNPRLRCMSDTGDGPPSHAGLRQIPYGFVHECGESNTLYIEGSHSGHVIRFHDTGRFRSSYFYCETCRRRVTPNGLGFRVCQCQPPPGQTSRPFMYGMRLDDTRAYMTQTVDLIDVRSETFLRAASTEAALPALLGALVGAPEYDRSRLMEYLESPPEMPSGAVLDARREELRALGVTDPETLERVIQSEFARRSPVASAYAALTDRSNRLFPAGHAARASAVADRSLREFVYVRDHADPHSVSLEELTTEAAAAGDDEAAPRRLEEQALLADLGIASLRAMTDLPVLLAAVGYTRVNREHAATHGGKPITVRMRLFPRDSENRYPVYTTRTTTEGLLFELDPVRQAAWLAANGAAETPREGFAHPSDAREWLLRQCPELLDGQPRHLVPRPGNPPLDAAALRCALLFGLTHSVSHLFLASAQSHVGFATDSLSEYLFPAAGAGLIYAKGSEAFTLGGIISVFRQGLRPWLAGVREGGQRCLMDPVCRGRGGSCHTCTRLKFACRHFNRTVSRAFLTGGSVSGQDTPLVGYWSREVRDRAQSLNRIRAG